MSVLRPILAACLAVAMLAAAPQLGAQTFPDPVSTTVNDFADLLPETDERALSQRLTRLERETGVELTVVTLATQADFAPDMTLEAYATALFDHWGVGKAETNDGVMMLSSATTARCGWNWARPTGATGTAWRRTWWNAISSTPFATGDYVRGITWGTEQTIERIVLPFREGAAPQAGGGLRDWIVGIGMFGAVLLAMSRRWIGDLLARLRRCPQCGRRGLRQTARS
jgi:uncharacterized protein